MVFRLIVILLIFRSFSVAQSIGFGCFGLVGGFAGYGNQNIKSGELNDFVNAFNASKSDSISSRLPSFGVLRGFRFGLNVAEKDFDGLVLTVKVFYEALNQKNSALVTDNASRTSSYFYEVKQKNYGAGVSLGTKIIPSLHWKVLEWSLFYTDVRLFRSYSYPGTQFTTEEFKSDKTDFGTFLGSGFVWYIVGNYISLEGSAGYSLYNISKLKSSSGRYFTATFGAVNPAGDFINQAGLFSLLQINLGFPL